MRYFRLRAGPRAQVSPILPPIPVPQRTHTMTELQRLLATLKRRLKARGLTYRDVALTLGLSEPSVKRLFSSGRISLDRLARVCELLDSSLAELALEAVSAAPRLSRLERRQESALVSDSRLLLVATCALNHWQFEDMVSRYRLDEAECIRHLLRLERMDLISLLPGNRIRINVARDFDWLPDGPIERYFSEHGRQDFLSGAFDGQEEAAFFVHGMLTRPAQARFNEQLRRLRQSFASLHDESLSAPLAERHGTAMLLALREWEPEAFASLRRP